MKKLRLLVTDFCPRVCDGCCNKQWDLDALPVCTDFRGYDEVLLTGGEPMLDLPRLHKAITMIRAVNKTAKIYLYTAHPRAADNIVTVLRRLDGITLTLHTQADVRWFHKLDAVLTWRAIGSKSYRLNVFREVKLNHASCRWLIKDDMMVWIPDCPLPEDEVFMRFE